MLFDAGGVLLLPEVVRPLETLQRLGIDVEVTALDRAHYAGMAAVDRAMRSIQLGPGGLTSAVWTDSLRDVYRTAKKDSLGLVGDLSPTLEDALFEAAWTRVAPGGIAALRAIAEQKLPIGIVSNAGGTVEADLKAASICQVGDGAGVCVTAVIDSSVVGVAKPDPAIFNYALDAAGTPPERAIFIGDSIAIDVAGASLAAIRGVHFDPFGFCEAVGHDDVTDLMQLLPMLAG